MSNNISAEEIAVRLYELDIKVYESTDSTMGKVFPAGKELTVKHMMKRIKTDKRHFLKDAATLISNMINTVEDAKEAEEYRKELNEIRKMIEQYSPYDVKPDSFSSNISNMKNRFSENDHMIICIGREYGSGGHEIGYRLAERLGISYYDKEILKIASENFDSDVEALTKHDEKISAQTFLDKTPFRFFGFSGTDSLFFAQCELIEQMATKSDCVIMGRCADVILEHAGVPRLSVFIGAPFEERVKHEMTCTDISRDKAMELVRKMDKDRAAYYNFYTSRGWGHSDNYDMCINTACYGIEGTVDMLENMAKFAYGQHKLAE